MTVVTGMVSRRQAILPLLCLAALAMSGMVACAALPVRAGGVGPPASVVGRQGLLVIPVRFSDTSPSRTIHEITAKVRRVAKYVSEASYGRASIDPRVLDWQAMPRPLAEYRISPYNYRVDRARVRGTPSRRRRTPLGSTTSSTSTSWPASIPSRAPATG